MTQKEELSVPPADDDGPRLSSSRKVAATVGVAIALLVVSLDGTIVGTAMPRILADLRGLNYYAWVVTAYLVTSTILMPIAGKLGDLFGRKPLVLIGLAGFLGTSWLVGASTSTLELILLRGVQGLFGGVLTAVTFAVVADIYPVRQRVKLHGLFSAIIGLSVVAAPPLGGYITDNWGWRWIFYVNVPIGALAVGLTFFFLPYVATRRSWRDIDFAGCVALAVALVPILIALSISNDHAWTSPLMLGLIAVSVVGLPVFLFVERSVANPIVPLGLFLDPVFTIAMVIAGLSAVGLYGLAVFIPLLYQGVLGETATGSGTLLTPLLLGMLVASPVSGQLIARVRYYRFIGTVGLAAMVAGLLMLTTVTLTSPHWHVVADLVVLGMGMGLVWPLSTAVVQASMAKEVVGVATAQVNFWRNLGGTVAVVVLGSIMANRLSVEIASRLATVSAPPELLRKLTGGGSQDLSTLFDPAQVGRLREQVPEAQRALFELVERSMRTGLADVLHLVFLVAAVILAIPLVASLFLKETPIPPARSRREEPAAEEV
ncbi:DHA2 family efflux MFS transporter permease subunit [Sphaerisporangium sp. NPDC049002]|uniref:DHA2 family efflux MFS transporter permease subunit n=1 Tax=unclassified Sphaerisporangium TaxID=2630420 RepID=UPI003407C03F